MKKFNTIYEIFDDFLNGFFWTSQDSYFKKEYFTKENLEELLSIIIYNRRTGYLILMKNLKDTNLFILAKYINMRVYIIKMNKF